MRLREASSMASPPSAILAAVGRFHPKYTDEQREAIARAMNDRRMSAPEAVKAAAEGGLEGLPSFEMPESTARDIANTARRQPTQPVGDCAAALRSLQDRGLSLIEEEMTKAEEASERGELSNAQLTRLAKCMRLARSLGDLHVTPRSPAPEPQQGDDHSDVLEELQAALASRGNGGDHESDELAS